MSFNYFERYVLECGYVAEPFLHDYGYDASVFTYDENGEAEPGRILVQLKATDHLKTLKDGKTISFSMDRRDLKLWLREAEPVIFVVYDAQKKRAYWLHVQGYFHEIPRQELFTMGGSIAVRIPLSHRLNCNAVKRFAKYRDASFPSPPLRRFS